MSLRLLSSGVVALGLALLIVSPAQSQFPPNRNPGQQKMQPFNTKGTLVAASQNQLQLSTNTNQKILVMIGPNTEVSVTGTAERDYLKAGVNVEFVAELDKAHTAKDKIIKLVIITPTSDRPAGLFAPEFSTRETKAEKGDKGRPDPGVGPAAKGRKGNADVDPLSGDSSASKPAKGRSGATQFPGTFTVRGKIKMCKEGKITVQAGHGPTVKADLGDDVAIDVDMADLTAAQPDDAVEVDGFTGPKGPSLVMGKSIKIELAKPLTGAKKHSTHTKSPAAHPSKAKKDAAGGDDVLGK